MMSIEAQLAPLVKSELIAMEIKDVLEDVFELSSQSSGKTLKIENLTILDKPVDGFIVVQIKAGGRELEINLNSHSIVAYEINGGVKTPLLSKPALDSAEKQRLWDDQELKDCHGLVGELLSLKIRLVDVKSDEAGVVVHLNFQEGRNIEVTRNIEMISIVEIKEGTKNTLVSVERQTTDSDKDLQAIESIQFFLQYLIVDRVVDFEYADVFNEETQFDVEEVADLIYTVFEGLEA